MVTFFSLKLESFKLTCLEQWKDGYVRPFFTFPSLCLIDELIVTIE